MLKKIKNGGILTLVLAAGMAVLQPASAQAADRHDGGGYNNRGRVERNWNRDRGGDRRDYRVYRDSDRGRRDRGYVYYNYAPAPRYGNDYYAYPSYGAYPYCPR